MLFEGPYAEQAVKRVNAVFAENDRHLTYNTDDVMTCILVTQDLVIPNRVPCKMVKGTIYYNNGAKAHVEPLYVHMGEYNLYCALESLADMQRDGVIDGLE